MMYTMQKCPVCSNNMVGGRQSWHFVCKICGYENAEFGPSINVNSAHELVDEKARETGLHQLRVSNFKVLLSVITQLKPGGGRLLDVGCAHGWFIEVAKTHFSTLGIEPDILVSDIAQKRGLPIRYGYFPGALKSGELFDVIIFNDVIEHIPDIKSTLECCAEHLKDDGLLVLNLPSSDGFFYRVSRMLADIGFRAPFERMWQKSLPSPHVHYFNKKNLVCLLQQQRFRCIAEGQLPTVRLGGLFSRISYTGDYGHVLKIVLYLGAALVLPILRVMPSDIIYIVSKKEPRG